MDSQQHYPPYSKFLFTDTSIISLKMDRKAQASTEYLVILAVVIVVAVVVVGLLGGFLDFGGEIDDSQSKMYWEDMRPDIGITFQQMDSEGDDALAIINNQDYPIEIKEITIGGNSVGFNNTILRPGQELKKVRGEWSNCEEGESYSYEVSFLYVNEEYNVTSVFTGTQDILGRCQ